LKIPPTLSSVSCSWYEDSSCVEKVYKQSSFMAQLASYNLRHIISWRNLCTREDV
jgi:hypothetical protein